MNGSQKWDKEHRIIPFTSRQYRVDWESCPDPDNPEVFKPFPNWQPVRCPQCSWHGPAAKAVKWFGDERQYCPTCNITVVKHEIVTSKG